MNTNYLTLNHPETYKDFFNKYDLVISTPFAFPLVWDTSIHSEGNTWMISQKLPLRQYMGINFSHNDKDIEFVYYENDEFKKWKLEHFFSLSKDFFDEIWINYQIGFLSEYHYHNISTIISNISIIKWLVDKKININDIEKLDLDSENYSEICDKILDIDKDLLKNHNLFSNIRNNSIYIWNCILKSNSHILSLEKNNEIEYKNIGNKNNFNQLDLCLSIISPDSKIKNNYNPKIIIEKNKNLSHFIKSFWIFSKKTEDVNLLGWLEQITSHYSIKIIKNLKYLYEENPLWNSFFKNLSSYRNIVKAIFSNFNKNLFNINIIKKKLINIINDKNINLYVDSIWTNWDTKILVISNKTWEIDKKTIKKINKELWMELKLDYNSFYDGFEKDGSKLEQYRSKWILSSYSSENIIISISNNWKNIETIDYANIKKNEKWLILDTIEKKIYLNWKKLTSKEVPSQSWTIEILEILIKNLWKKVYNDNLPISSYSKNKNDMIWKIITPISKLIKQENKKNIELTCKWSLVKFYLQLNKSDFNISLIKSQK